MADRPTKPSGRSGLWLAGGLGLVALAALAIWLLTGPSSGADLGSLPEAQLRYPASQPLSEGSHDRVDDVLGTTNAAWWMILGTDASIDEVLRFYESELPQRSWQFGSRVGSTDEVATYSWDHANLRFRLGFKDTEEWHQRLAGSERFSTLYEIRLIEREPSG